MPAVHAEAELAAVEMVRSQHLQSGIGRGKGRVPVMGGGILEIVGAAEVILRARAADSGIIGVAIYVELDLPFSPPVGIVHAPGQISAHILSLALDSVQDGVDLLVGQRVHTAELGVEIGNLLRQFL